MGEDQAEIWRRRSALNSWFEERKLHPCHTAPARVTSPNHSRLSLLSKRPREERLLTGSQRGSSSVAIQVVVHDCRVLATLHPFERVYIPCWSRCFIGDLSDCGQVLLIQLEVEQTDRIGQVSRITGVLVASGLTVFSTSLSRCAGRVESIRWGRLRSRRQATAWG